MANSSYPGDNSDGPDIFGAVNALSFNNMIGNAGSMYGISNGSNGNVVGLSATQIGLARSNHASWVCRTVMLAFPIAIARTPENSIRHAE
jgi:hypothetical protein